MRKEFSFTTSSGIKMYAYKWAADKPKAVVQIAHGAVEHALRYDHFAKALVKSGYSVYANDHRGHGKTAQGVKNVGHYGEQKGGFALAVEDMHDITNIIKKENKGIPVFLFGHSMGSLMSRVYAAKYGSEIDGLLLTGTGRVSSFLIGIVRFLAKCHMVLLGRSDRSVFLHSLVFGTLNRPFKGETGSEFISADSAVVDAYVKDEFCGNTVSAEFVYELLWGTKRAAMKKTFENTPKNLPVFIGAGEFDTVGGNKLAAVKKDAADFGRQDDLTFKVYEGMRHEILNEKEKLIVYDDIMKWISKRV